MAGSDDDLDWLYRKGSHGRNVPDPGEHTRRLSEAEEKALAARRGAASSSPAAGGPGSGWPEPTGASRPEPGPDSVPDYAVGAQKTAGSQNPGASQKPAGSDTPARAGRKTFSESDVTPRQSFGEPGPDRARASAPRGGTAVLPTRRPTRERGAGGDLPPPPVGPGSPDGPVPPPGPPPRPRRKRHPVRATLITLLVLVLALLGYLIGVPAAAWSKAGKVDEAPSGQRPSRQPGELYLLVGSDSRKGLSKEEQKKLGTGSVEGNRTDTMMLLYVPPSGQPALISIPRDSYVPIPDNGSNKINAAYTFGGAKLLTKTVEQNTGLRIDGYMEVGFGGFVNVIDAVGGIEMCPKSAIKDKDSHLDIPAGCQNMDGVTALGYVRMRKADPRGDLGRVERQREMLSALAKKAATPASVVNPVRYWNLNTAVAGSLKTGQDTSTFDVARMGLAMMKISKGEGLTLTVPIGNPNASTSAGSAVLWDEADSKAMFSEIAKGDTSKLKRFKTK